MPVVRLQIEYAAGAFRDRRSVRGPLWSPIRSSTASVAVGDYNHPAGRLLRGHRLWRGYPGSAMTIGMSIFLIAAGAILKYAVTADVEGIEIDVVGTILIIAGILGLVISLLYTAMWSDRGGGGRADAPPPSPYDQPTRRNRY